MANMAQLRSPMPWQGGKHYSAQFIVSQFPAASTYDVFVDVFGGAANVLLTKPAGKHLEIYNDLNGDLVNCWMHLRDQSRLMEERLQTLPYARSLYSQYHQSLFDGTKLDLLERAVRWYYVLISSFRATVEETPSGWINGVTGLHSGKQGDYAGQLHAHSYQRRLVNLSPIANRFQTVEIDCRDFEAVIKQYEQSYNLRTLLYCDPPYIDAEHYYQASATDESSKAFHERLARVLNATPAMVALSYYEHPWLDELYPASKWRRVRYETVKHSQRTKAVHDRASEVLLCNYPAVAAAEPVSLWDSIAEEAV